MKYIFLFITALSLLILDAMTKLLSETYLKAEILLIPNFLSLEYYQNPGIAFSFPLTGLALKIITCILIFGIIWYYITQEKKKNNIMLDSAYTLILAGALGNAWERIFRGYVTDMISVERFAVFNLADSCISLGALILLYIYWKHP